MKRPRPSPVLDQFAEVLAETGDVATAAAAIGGSRAYGRVLLQRLIQRLGRDQCR